MTRAKVQMTLIESEGARKTSLKKRKGGLVKKMNELSTLCGVDSCVVIYNPDSSEPDLWPSRLATEHVMQRYRDMPDFEKNKKILDQESFANQELAKVLMQLNKAQKENRLKEFEIIMNGNMSNDREWLQSLDNDYLSFINNQMLKPRIKELEQRIAMFNQEPSATTQE